MILSHSATLQEIIGKLTSKTIPVDQGRSLEHTRTCKADPEIVNKSEFNFSSGNLFVYSSPDAVLRCRPDRRLAAIQSRGWVSWGRHGPHCPHHSLSQWPPPGRSGGRHWQSSPFPPSSAWPGPRHRQPHSHRYRQDNPGIRELCHLYFVFINLVSNYVTTRIM